MTASDLRLLRLVVSMPRPTSHAEHRSPACFMNMDGVAYLLQKCTASLRVLVRRVPERRAGVCGMRVWPWMVCW